VTATAPGGAAPGDGRIRVCHVITMLELGGAQANTLHTVLNLDRSRFDSSLVTGTTGPLVEEARVSGARCVFLPDLVRPISPLRDLRAFLDLKRLFREERPSIVHTHSSKAGILGRLAARSAGVPAIVHSIHGWGFHPGQHPIARAFFVSLERRAAGATSAFIAVSEASLRQGIEMKILDARRARVLHSGIRLRDFRPAGPGERAAAPWPRPPAGGATVGMIACFKPQKAPLDFVRVAAEVIAAEPTVRFVLVGDGELRGAIEELIRERGIGGSVTLLGWRRDVPDLMRSFDILLHTSRWEGLPRVFPEAMASGIPIVATRVDGAPEAIVEGVNGRLREPGDVAGLAAAVLELARDPAMRRRMGEAGLARAGGWDIDEMVRAQERLYLDLLREREGRDGIISPASAAGAAAEPR
jgi:glycosyltransferase involved in cell wall biosynthesis